MNESIATSSIHLKTKNLKIRIAFFLRFTVLIFSLFNSQTAYADDLGNITTPTAEDGLAAFELSVPKDYISDFPNELISSQDMNLSLEYEDINIPGPNGMDIAVVRKYKNGAFTQVVGFGQRGWFLDLPLIRTFRSLQSGPPAVSIGCLQNVQTISVDIEGNTLRSVGYSSQSRFPSNTLAAFNDRSILVCESGYPVLKKSDGTKYTFGISQTSNFSSAVFKLYYLSKITDRFGNYLSYEYTDENATFPSSYPRKKLIKISRNDGYVVNLNYEKVGNYEQIKSISYKSRSVSYSYNSTNNLTIFRDQAGRQYTYEYYPYINSLKSVTTPENLKVVYDYHPLNADSINYGNLRGKTISGPGIITRQFFHEILPSGGIYPNSYSRTKQVEFDVLPGQEKTIEYRFQRIPNVASSFQDGSIVLASKLLSKSVYLGYSGTRNNSAYLGDKLLIKQENIWDYQNFGTAGCSYRIGTSRNDWRTCATPILTSEKISINNNGVFDTYYSDYSQHNEFGSAQLVYEYSSTSPKKRYTNTIFSNDYANWITNRVNFRKVSADNASWKNELQVDYYSWDQGLGYRSQVKLTKRFNIVNKSYTQYHPNGEVKIIKDATNQSFNYDDYYLGIARKITLPGVTQAKTLAVNEFGEIKSITDYLGNTSNFDYDNVGRLLVTTFPKVNAKDFWFNSIHQYKPVDSDDIEIAGGGIVSGEYKKVSVRGNFQKTEYFDANSRVVLVQLVDLGDSSSARYTRIEYDNRNNMIFQSFPSEYAGTHEGTYYSYDELNRPIEIKIESNVTTIEYLSGNRKKITNDRGYSTTYSYQAFGSPSMSKVTKIQSPHGITTAINRDVFGKITDIKQSGYFEGNYVSSSRYYYYDNRELLCRVYNPETGYTAYKYDDSYNLSWEFVGASLDYCNYTGTPPEEAVQFTYDPRKNITYVNNPRGATDFSFTYDDNNNMTSASRGDIVWSYQYNNLNLITRETLAIDGKNFTVNYGYNADGYQSSIQFPSGRIIDYIPNAFGEATRANRYVKSVFYHPNGKIKKFQYGNGKSYQQSLNLRSLPENIYVGGVSDLFYQYDSQNNITSISDRINPTENRNMTYDGLDRLTRANGPWGASTVEYDPLGNIMKKILGSKSYNFYYDRSKNRLTSVTGSKYYSFEYDTQGNVKSNGMQTFVYDKANLLMNVNLGAVARYQYDANKKRVRVTGGGKDIYHFYTKAGKLLYKYEPFKNKGSDYIYINDLLIAKLEGAPGAQPPLAPASISIPNYNTGGTYSVNWSSSTGATSYTLQEKKNSGIWTTVYSGNRLDKYLIGRTSASYQYRVRACSSSGCGQYRESKIFGVFNLDDAYVVPITPSKPMTPIIDNDGSFYVNWTTVSGATSYQVQQKLGTGAWATKQTSPDLIYYADSLVNGVYSYRVRACNTNGCSGFSLEASVSVIIFDGGSGICKPGQICRIIK